MGLCTFGADVDSRKNGTKTNFRDEKGSWSAPLTKIESTHEFFHENPMWENEPLAFEQNENERRAFFLSAQPLDRFFHSK